MSLCVCLFLKSGKFQKVLFHVFFDEKIMDRLQTYTRSTFVPDLEGQNIIYIIFILSLQYETSQVLPAKDVNANFKQLYL